MRSLLNWLTPFFRSNFVQLNLYACNPFIVERGIDHAAIIQYNKNDSRLREVRFRPSQRLADSIAEIDIAIADVVDRTKDPTQVVKDYILGSIKCAFCTFKATCWQDDTDAMKAYFKELPAKSWPSDIDRLGAVSAEEIYALFERRYVVEAAEKDLKQVDQEIMLALQREGLRKIRLPNKEVYEVKQLKSGNELRRSKA